MSSFRERIAEALFGDIIKKKLAAVTVRVDDSPGWEPLAGGGPHDRTWGEVYQDLEDALEAWRKNFMVRRIVGLARAYVVGDGIHVTSKQREVDSFIRVFWRHPKNRMARRLGPMCDELTRAGELFATLHTNSVDGISYVRFVPASQIREIETDKDDYEKELRYGEVQQFTTELKWWVSPEHPSAFPPNQQPGTVGAGLGTVPVVGSPRPGGNNLLAAPLTDRDYAPLTDRDYATALFQEAGNGPPPPAPGLPPLMLHFAVNRPIGATRGESDLATVLKWALRYSNWLEDRVRLNRTRTRQAMLDVQIADDTQVEKKKLQLRQDDPFNAGIYIHGSGESATLHSLNIRADDAEPDGLALRLAIAAGSGTALHYLGEGANVNYATAKEMGEPTARFYTERQTQFIDFLQDLITVAHRRYLLVTGKRAPAGGDLQLQSSVTEIARADNQALATAARDIVTALAEMRANGWIDDATAIRLAFKFAGETIDEDQINEILETVEPENTESAWDNDDNQSLRVVHDNDFPEM